MCTHYLHAIFHNQFLVLSRRLAGMSKVIFFVGSKSSDQRRTGDDVAGNKQSEWLRGTLDYHPTEPPPRFVSQAIR
jgi:hypothetical protein